MSAGYSDYDVWMYFMTNFMRSVHTIKPAVITSVEGNRVRCRITTKTRYSSNREEADQPDIEVPYLIVSAKRGQARVTVPLTAGDLVVVLFSDRSYGDLLETDGQEIMYNPSKTNHNYDPILAIPCFLTTPDTDTYSEDVKVVHGDGSLSINAEGELIARGSRFDFGSDSQNLFDLLGQLSTQVGNLTTALSGHTHSSSGAGTPNPTTPTFASISSAVGTITTNINNLV